MAYGLISHRGKTSFRFKAFQFTELQRFPRNFEARGSLAIAEQRWTHRAISALDNRSRLMEYLKCGRVTF